MLSSDGDRVLWSTDLFTNVHVVTLSINHKADAILRCKISSIMVTHPLQSLEQ